ncbi:hypothetical protein GA0070216_109202 [Micromonospora matsumotoense]|uniref:ATPase AAA-type core domain-containing protein n=1 Tax=Micromonospora matsumotoense TaxID=121616 RepID=A0A1C4ZH15_9ACTN|nr:ATP-binding protein [Micromonospora matsumotoense]SCF32071.1 hypothetical protein GA0070216_109202 [Micromonospora matsumotoense]
MLLSFRFANHRSFADEQQLNFTPVYAPAGESPDSRLSVRVVGIFGGNASGKSNLLHALSYMRRMAIYSDRAVEPGLGISPNREPFRLDPAVAETPSRYTVDLHLNGVRHTYGFTVDDDRVVEEWLFHYPLKKKRRVFEREGDNFTWGEESKRNDLERVAAITAPTALFLSTIARFNRRAEGADRDEPQPLHDVYRWFFRTRIRSRPGLRPRNLGAVWSDLGDDRAAIVDLLRAADVGIVDVTVHSDPPQELFELDDVDADSPVTTPARPRKRLLFTHRGPTGLAILGYQDESTGTQQLLDLAIDASWVLNRGGVLAVDEIDASLHPMLTAKLIGLFQSPVTNPAHSQLIFTSHDATLLGTFDTEEVLSRDEIWFTEKAKDGTSSVYPLTDFKPRREGENRQRRYLNGNYGGVPDISTYLFERALATREATEGDGEE